MKGHTQLIAMRFNEEVKPRIIFLNDYPCETDWQDWGDHVTVCTHGDALSGLDLRFVVGTTVSISGPDERRVKSIFEKCKQAGATTVAGAHLVRINDYRFEGRWADVWTKEK